jgi:cyclohexyl-isocyanide hydratase
MMQHHESSHLNRRAFGQMSALGVAGALIGASGGAKADNIMDVEPEAFTKLRDKPLSIGILIFPELDQIDFTGPFEVLTRLPDTKVYAIGTQKGPFRGYEGLIVTPDMAMADAPPLDLLQVAGGPGQQALMNDTAVLSFIQAHAAGGKPIFSVCTGALLLGAAGILKGRRATTHWTALDLLPYFGATPVNERVVIDGHIVSAAGVTAGIDGALTVAALVRGKAVAQGVQLNIQYAPDPPFNSGTPETAPKDVLAAVEDAYAPLMRARLNTAKEVSVRLGITRT